MLFFSYQKAFRVFAALHDDGVTKRKLKTNNKFYALAVSDLIEELYFYIKSKVNYILLVSKIIPIVLAICLMGTCNQAAATASLASEDMIDEIPVTVKGVKLSFTVFRDARIEEQWYYIPDVPRIFERTINGKTEPEFALIRYQFADPDNAQQLLEGGLLQFAASLAVPPEAIPQLIKAIKDKIGKNKSVRLAAMPFKEANVNLYAPSDGKLIAGAPQGAGIAPIFATQKMAFSVSLTRTGSDVYDELVNGNTGIMIVVDFTFNGLTPPAGFKVEVDWDQTYDYYSKHQKFSAAASWKGLVGGAVGIDKQKLRTTLEENKCIKVLVTEGENLSKQEIDKYLEPILNRINQELLKKILPPEKIIPSKITAKSKNMFLSATYTASIKDIKHVKRGKEIIDFNVRQHQVRKTITSGFIGIGRYSDEVKEKLVTIVPEGPWQSAYFVLPAVGDADELGINQVDLQIGLSDNNQIRQSQVVVWTPKDGWKDRLGKPRTVLSFAMMGLEASGFDVKKAQFATKAQITLKGDVIKIEQMMPVFNGESAITTPLAAVDVVTVDGSLLNWSKIDDSSPLAAVNVKLKAGDRTFSGRLKPRRIEGEWLEPAPLFWLVEKGKDQVTANIKFLLKDGRKVDWKDNGKDLLDDLSSLEITLFDQEW